MRPPHRSLLRVDVKDLTPERPEPALNHMGKRAGGRMGAHHFGLMSVTAGVLLVGYALINGLSASDEEPTEAPVEVSGISPPPAAESMPHALPVESLDTEFIDTVAIALAAPAPPRQEFSDYDNSPVASALIEVEPVEIEPTEIGVTEISPPETVVTPPRIPASPAPPLEVASAKPAAVPEPATLKPATPNLTWTTAAVKPRDTLSRIFQRHGLRVQDAYAAAELKDAAVLKKIRLGAEIAFATDDAGALAALRYPVDRFTTIQVAREDGRLRAEVITRTPEIRIRGAKAAIWTNLLDAAKGAGMDFETVYDLAQLFGWQVDFAREIHGGDEFSVLFEELYLDDKKVGNGDILAAELIASNRILRAVRHVDAHGRSVYYAPDGGGIQRSFLRTPLKFSRVTSRFSHKRFHPILKKWRAHRGVDYGAPRGTPVRSTGDGVVVHARRDRGYGKTVLIRHGAKYTTLYAHLHRFADGITGGARVQQGDVIGYVGSTGWTTGAHLHYEFRVDGVHRNPLTVELPTSDPIAAEYRLEFVANAAAWVHRLGQIGADWPEVVVADVAQADGVEVEVTPIHAAQAPAQSAAQ